MTMTDTAKYLPDNEEAVDAALSAWLGTSVAGGFNAPLRAAMGEILAAALPLIRAQIADEIEAGRAETEQGRPGFAIGNATFNEGIDHAARIARG